MKLTLSDTASGYNRSVINNNFSLITQELQDKVLYRDNPDGEPNQMEQSLDLNGFNLLNVQEAQIQSLTVNGTDYEQTLQSIISDAQADIDQDVASAENFKDLAFDYAGQSLLSSQDAADSATAAATSETNAENLLNTFESVFYGVASSDPTTDPNGDPPTEGDLYYNDTENQLKVRVNGLWVSAPDAPVFDVFGRVGNVVAQAGDYTALQIDYDNTDSGSSATDVKGALDNIYSQIGDIGTTLDEINGEVI